MSGAVRLDRGGATTWTRHLDLVVPMWQGADDHRVTGGPTVLAGLIERGPVRRVIEVPSHAGAREAGVCHLDVLAGAHREVRRVLMEEAPERVLVLGSDCAIEAVTISYLAERHGRVAVAWLDAHADLNTPASSPSGAAHGMALRLLMGDGHPSLLPPEGGALDPSAVALAGVRTLDGAEAEFVTARDVPRVTVEELGRHPGRVARGLPPGLPVYVHLDMDVFDPAAFPATAWPTPDGLGVTAFERVMDELFSDRDVVGIGVVEFVPGIEHDPDVLRRILAALRLR